MRNYVIASVVSASVALGILGAHRLLTARHDNLPHLDPAPVALDESDEFDIAVLTGNKFWNCDCCSEFIEGDFFFAEKLDSSEPSNPEAYYEICTLCWHHGYNEQSLKDSLTSDEPLQPAREKKVAQMQAMQQFRKMYVGNERKQWRRAKAINAQDIVAAMLQIMSQIKGNPPQQQSMSENFATLETAIEDLHQLSSSDSIKQVIEQGKVTEAQAKAMQASGIKYISFLEKHLYSQLQKCVRDSFNAPWKTVEYKTIGLRFEIPANWTSAIYLTGSFEKIYLYPKGKTVSSRLPGFDMEQISGENIIVDTAQFFRSWLQHRLNSSNEYKIISEEMFEIGERKVPLNFVELIFEIPHQQKIVHGYFACAVTNNRAYVFEYTEYTGKINYNGTLLDRPTICRFVERIQFIDASLGDHALKVKTRDGLSMYLPDSVYSARLLFDRKFYLVARALKEQAQELCLELGITKKEIGEASKQQNAQLIKEIQLPYLQIMASLNSVKSQYPHVLTRSVTFSHNNTDFNLFVSAKNNTVDVDKTVEYCAQSIQFEPCYTYFDQIVFKKHNPHITNIYENKIHQFEMMYDGAIYMCHHDARKFEIDLRILMWTQSRTLICNVSVLTSDKINSCSTSLDDAEALIQQIIQSEEANQTIKVLNKTPRLVQTSTLPIPAIEVAFQASSGVTSVTWVFFKPDRYCEADKTRVFALTSVSKHNVPIVEFFNEVHKFHSSFKFNRPCKDFVRTHQGLQNLMHHYTNLVIETTN